LILFSGRGEKVTPLEPGDEEKKREGRNSKTGVKKIRIGGLAFPR